MLNRISLNYGYSRCQSSRLCRYPTPNSAFLALQPAAVALNLREQTVPVNIIRQITKAYLCFGSNQANRTYHQIARPHSLHAEDMLDATTYFRPAIIAFALAFGQPFIAAAFLLHTTAKSLLFKKPAFVCGAIGRIRPDILAGVVFIKQLLKNFTVMHRSVSDIKVTNQLMLHIYINVVFISELISAMLFYPTGVGVFLPFLVITPAVWNIAFFNLLVFVPAVTLLRSGNNTGINDLSLSGGKAIVPKELVELVKQLFNQAALGKLLSEQPDRLGVRDRVGNRHFEKSHEGEPIPDLKLNLVVGKIVQRLQDHYFEHDDHVERLPASIGLSLFVANSFKACTELAPVHDFVKPDKRIWAFFELFKTGLPIKQTGSHLQSFAENTKNRNLLINELIIPNVKPIALN